VKYISIIFKSNLEKRFYLYIYKIFSPYINLFYQKDQRVNNNQNGTTRPHFTICPDDLNAIALNMAVKLILSISMSNFNDCCHRITFHLRFISDSVLGFVVYYLVFLWSSLSFICTSFSIQTIIN